jgi:hypothetical protein
VTPIYGLRVRCLARLVPPFPLNLVPLLEKIIGARVPWRLYAPEGLDTRFLAQSQELCDLLKAAQFQRFLTG